MDTTRTIVRMLPGNYETNLTITGKTLWIDGTGAVLTGGSSTNALEINNGAHVRITGLSILSLNLGGSTGAALRCETLSSTDVTPVIDLDGVSIDSSLFGFFLTPCTLTATQSHFHVRSTGNANVYAAAGNNGDASRVNIDRCVIDGGDGVQALQYTTVTVTNSLIENMTGPHGAMLGTNFYVGVGNPSPSGILFASFDTLVNAPLICQNGTPSCLGGPTTNPLSIDGICIDNSVITTTTSNAVTGTGCIVNHSLAFPQTAALTGANNLTNVDPRFVDPANNFQLSASSPAVDTADAAATDAIDLIGTTRPQGLRDDLGAYEYKP